jgi:hypothetical protein
MGVTPSPGPKDLAIAAALTLAFLAAVVAMTYLMMQLLVVVP